MPLLVAEAGTARARELYADDTEMAAWWATEIECVSALARRERNEQLEPDETRHALDRLRRLTSAWTEIAPSERVRRVACRLPRVHDVRAADALQLAAAIVGAAEDTDSYEFVSFDERLSRAAALEGFRILG